MSSVARSAQNVIGNLLSRKKTPNNLENRASYITGEDDILLARPAPRHGIRSNLPSWSNDTVSAERGGSDGSTFDPHFASDMQKGIYRRLPEKSSFVLKNRKKATMAEEPNAQQLPRNVEDVRIRQEHVERRVQTMPSLFSEDARGRSLSEVISIIRNAVFRELNDLYKIMSSLEARKYDLCGSDVQSTFAWFKLLENFIRVYFSASESEVYGKTGIDSWGNLSGKLTSDKRKKEKMKIVALSDRVEQMKRVMLAMGCRCGQLVAQLQAKVDDFAMRLVRFLNEEVEQIPCQLESKFGTSEMAIILGGLVQEMRGAETGREVVLLMSRGLTAGGTERVEWIRKMCGGPTRVTAQSWMRKFADRHSNYVRLFVAAEGEYQDMYNDLSRVLDAEIQGIHDG